MEKYILDSVFRAYDIRGRYPSELNKEFYEDLGKSYVTYYKPHKVVVGNDMRPSSLELKESLIKGLTTMGCDVIDLGEVAAEMVYFAVGEYEDLFQGGFYITASHNGPDWNGCKLLGKGAKFVGALTGLKDLKNIIMERNFQKVSDIPGSSKNLDIYPAYKQKILSYLKLDKRKNIKIVFDAGNGMGGKIFDYVFSDLGIEVEKMYFEPDGNFPNHLPNPMEEENVLELRKRVLETDADFGIATDGDGDRAFFVDKKGRRPNGTYTGVLISKTLINNNPDNNRIVIDPRLTWPFKKESNNIGAEIFQSVAGRSNIRSKMEETDALFGVENSSHFFYKDYYKCDSGMATIAHMLNMYYEGFDLTKELDYLFENYPNSGEVNYVVENPLGIISKIEDFYSKQGGKIEKIDGLTVEFSDWRFNLRNSNTQLLLRLNLEGTNKDIVIEKFLEVERMIGSARDNLPALEELRKV